MLHTTPFLCFFFNDTATTEIYTLSLHDALPITILKWSCLKRRAPHDAIRSGLRGNSAATGPGSGRRPVGSPGAARVSLVSQSRRGLIDHPLRGDRHLPADLPLDRRLGQVCFLRPPAAPVLRQPICAWRHQRHRDREPLHLPRRNHPPAPLRQALTDCSSHPRPRPLSTSLQKFANVSKTLANARGSDQSRDRNVRERSSRNTKPYLWNGVLSLAKQSHPLFQRAEPGGVAHGRVSRFTARFSACHSRRSHRK